MDVKQAVEILDKRTGELAMLIEELTKDNLILRKEIRELKEKKSCFINQTKE